MNIVGFLLVVEKFLIECKRKIYFVNKFKGNKTKNGD